MKFTTLALAAAAGIAASAQAQVTMYLVATQDLSSLSDGQSIEVGSLPSGVALIRETINVNGTDFDVESLFVGGLTATAFGNVGIVKLEDVYNFNGGPRLFRQVRNNTNNASPTFFTSISAANRGVTGMDYQPNVGLVATFDQGGFGWETGGQQIVWDVNTQLNPIVTAVSPAFGDLRGIAGPAWDAGPDGAGFSYTGGSGPVVSILDFSSNSAGPFGLNPTTLDGNSNQEVYSFFTAPQGPILNVADPNGAAVGGTIWRDLDISPDGNLIVARADNDVVIAQRSGTQGATVTKVVRSSATNNDAPFVVGQNGEILHGAVGGDLIVYNSRPSSGSLTLGFNSIRFIDTAGNPVTVDFLLPDGTPAALPQSGTGYYHFFWDRGQLVVLDGSVATGDNPGRTAYVFKQCLGDVDRSGLTDLDDFFAFLGAFDAGTLYGDVNRSGLTDLDDFFAFLGAFDAGC